MAKYDKDAVILQHIIKYCDRVREAQNRFGTSCGAFASDSDYQSCCSMYVFQISENSIHLSDAMKTACPQIPWQKIKGMRNILAHDYEAVKTERLWDTMQNDLPKLREDCLRILMDFGHEYRPEDNDDERLADDDED